MKLRFLWSSETWKTSFLKIFYYLTDDLNNKTTLFFQGNKKAEQNKSLKMISTHPLH